ATVSLEWRGMVGSLFLVTPRRGGTAGSTAGPFIRRLGATRGLQCNNPEGRIHWRTAMHLENLLRLARETVDAVPTCLAITIDSNGDANARAINTSKLTDEWTLRFMTDRRTRKVGEIAQR